MLINWYPGHMAKARRMIEENLKVIDVVIELLDARIPRSSANPIISELVGNKPHVIVLNKADLSSPEDVRMWTEYYKEQGIPVIAMNSTAGRGTKQLIKAVENLSAPIIDKWVSRGMKARSVRTIILGIPNVGKSTLINVLAGNAATKVADKPGQTKGKQWVKIGKNLELLDTPGVLWPKLEDQTAAYRLAATGAISEDVFDMSYVVGRLVKEVLANNKDVFLARFKLDPSVADEEAETIIEIIGRKRGCLLSGGIIDLEKARKIILNEFKDGKLGNFSLDHPDEEVVLYTDEMNYEK